MFYHGYENYMKHAFPEDELKPLTCKPLSRDRLDPTHIELNDALGNYSLSLVDSLTTLAVLASSSSKGQRTKALHHFHSGVAALVEQYGDGSDGPAGQGLRARGFDLDSKVQVFETVIRGVGGLLSAHLFAIGELPIIGYNPYNAASANGTISIQWPHHFTYDGQLLRLARDLANRLLPAFHTDTGIPYPRVNLRHGIPFYSESPLHRDAENGMCHKIPQRSAELTETCSAGAGSLLLEFTTLSRLADDPQFELLGKKAFWSIWDRKGSTGLVGAGIDAESGLWTSSYTGIGAGIDSFYEYAAKAYVFLSGATYSSPSADKTQARYDSPESYLDVWLEAHSAINHHLRRGKMFIHPHYIQADVFTGAARAHWFDSLSAFFPGLLTITGSVEEATESHLLNTALWSRYSALPERWSTSSGSVEGGLGWWGGRPEFIESTYYLYRATRDPWYLHIGEMVLRDIKRRCWAKCGWSGIQDVRSGERSDRMESYFLSETAKYLFLLFEPNHPLNKLDSPFIFNTEGHPLILPRTKHPHAYSKNTPALQTSPPSTNATPQTCPVPPTQHPFSISAVAARGDVYHAANLARLHFMPTHETLESPLIEYSADHPSTSISDVRSPSNFTYFPWTLPLELVPYNATCEKMTARPTFDITFPTLPNGVLGPGSLQRVLNGILVNSISGLRLGMIQDVKMDIEGVPNPGELYRVQAINNIAMGKDEKVFVAKDTAASVVNPLDPNFTRVRDMSMLDLVIDVAPEQICRTEETTSLFDHNDTSTSSPDLVYSSPAHEEAHAESSMKLAFNSLIEHVAALINNEPQETTRGLLREYYPAITPTGAGAAPLPDVEDAFGPDINGSPRGDLLWHSIYVTGNNCRNRLPMSVARDNQILVMKRGGCSFSQKLQNIPSVPPSKNSLQMVIVISYDDAEAGLPSGWLVRPLLESQQLTSTGLPRHRPIPMVMVGGGDKTYEIFQRAVGLGLKRRYSVQAQGVPISNLIMI
ncbi:MAG: hypothetical protein Q9166_000964 [cf. Caloplaca sp. 2 TL-2023]